MHDRKTYDAGERLRIRIALFEYAKANRLTSGKLAQAISDAHPNQPIIDPRRLRRMENEEHDPQDAFYSWCDHFLRSVAAPKSRLEDMAEALVSFYGPRPLSGLSGDYIGEIEDSGPLRPELVRVIIRPAGTFWTIQISHVDRNLHYDGAMIQGSAGVIAVAKERLLGHAVILTLTLMGGPRSRSLRGWISREDINESLRLELVNDVV